VVIWDHAGITFQRATNPDGSRDFVGMTKTASAGARNHAKSRPPNRTPRTRTMTTHQDIQDAPRIAGTLSAQYSEPLPATLSPPKAENTDVRPLATTIRWSGDGLRAPGAVVVLTQIRREGDIAIYKRTREQSGKLEGFEVIKVRVRSGKWFGSGPYEAYPSANDFGPYGLFVTTLARAEEVFARWKSLGA